jgi:hypothetical protein
VENKVTVALDFTTRTGAAGLGETSPLPNSYLTAARGVLSGVDGSALNDASVAAGENATTAYIANPATGQVAAGVMSAKAGSPIDDPLTITTSNNVIDPGVGDFTIQFLAGTSSDTLVLHGRGVDQVSGFDPTTDVLDLRSLLAGANVSLGGDFSALSSYLGVTEQNGNAVVSFDPTGHSGGGVVAILQGLGNTVTGLDKLVADGAIRIS